MSKKELREFKMNLDVYSFDSAIRLGQNKSFMKGLSKLNSFELYLLYFQSKGLDSPNLLPPFIRETLFNAMDAAMKYLMEKDQVHEFDAKFAAKLKKKYGDIRKLL